MAAEVFGSIVGANGVEDITLNNAATESTLKQLLASSMGANKQTLDSLKDLAKSAGLDPEIAARAEQNIDKLGAGAGDLDGDFGTLQQSTKKVNLNFNSIMASTGQMIEGTATLGGILNTLGGVLPGKLGFLIEMLGKAANFQDQSLQAYQKISDSGVRLAGDLIQIRISAAQMGLTLDQFTSLIKNNGPAFASLGETVDGGTTQFIKFSTALIRSDAGRQLMNMGYSLEQINANSLDYLLISGGRRKGELEGAAATKQTTESVLNYMSELDKLANLTGKSRDKIAQEIKELALEPAWQAFLNDPKNKNSKDALALSQTESARFGSSMAKNFQAAAMGLTVWSKDTAAAAGLLPETYNYLSQLSTVAQSSMSEGDKKLKIQELSSRAMYATVESARAMGRENLQRLAQEAGARGETARLMLTAMSEADRLGINSLRAQIARDNEAAALSLVTNKQVENANAVNVALKDIQVSLLTLLKGPLEIISPILRGFAEYLTFVSTGLLALGGILLAYKAYALSQVAKGKDTTGPMTRLFGSWGKSPDKALWVRVVPGGGTLSSMDLPGGGKGKEPAGKGGGLGGKVLGSLKGGLGGVVGGLTLGVASDYFTNNGMEKTGAGLDIASQAASFAGTGALLGALGGPLGAAIGGIAGGVLGAGYGLYQNSGTLFGSTPNIEKSSASKPEEAKLSVEQTSLVASYQKRNAENSDRMLLILRELTDITKDQRDLIRGKPTPDPPRGRTFGNAPTQ